VSFFSDNSTVPGDVIEVGCYKGGLTAELTYLSQEQGRKVHAIDICQESIYITKNLLVELGLENSVTFYLEDFFEFTFEPDFPDKVFLVVIDADHQYEAIKNDCLVLRSISDQVRGAVFHDFSLRYINNIYDSRVDEGIFAVFGTDVPLEMIGFLDSKNSPPHPEEGWYFEGYEGALLDFSKSGSYKKGIHFFQGGYKKCLSHSNKAICFLYHFIRKIWLMKTIRKVLLNIFYK
jgi:SAM-dependent methyltransferase